MSLLKAIKSLFKKASKKEVKQEEVKRATTESDFIDYDGMGNQGRFPSKNKTSK